MYDALTELQFNASRYAHLCGVSRRTINNWVKSGQMPAYAMTIVTMAMRGNTLTEEFTDWCIFDGLLISPEGEKYSPGDIKSLFWLRQINHHRPSQRVPVLRLV